jgi:hypothetical protein
MSKYIFLVSMFVVQQAGATGFHCYTMPNYPIQTFEYTSGLCLEGKPTGSTNKGVGTDGQKEVACMIVAGCAAVSDEEGAKPAPERTQQQLMADFTSGALKSSTLICRGTAKYSNGAPVSATCPPPSECQKEIFFNYFPPGVNATFAQPVNVPNPEGKPESRGYR